jgi:hypothetical protein
MGHGPHTSPLWGQSRAGGWRRAGARPPATTKNRQSTKTTTHCPTHRPRFRHGGEREAFARCPAAHACICYTPTACSLVWGRPRKGTSNHTLGNYHNPPFPPTGGAAARQERPAPDWAALTPASRGERCTQFWRPMSSLWGLNQDKASPNALGGSPTCR